MTSFRAKKRGELFTKEQARPYADSLRRLFVGKLPEAGAGVVIDDMIAKVHEQDPSLSPLRIGEIVIEMQPNASVKVATELSAIPRVRRIALGKRYLRAIHLAAEKQRDVWKSTHSPRRSDCMLFLSRPLPIGQRQERQKRLLTLTDLLKHYRQVKKAIGIATEAGEDAGRSYDFVYLEGEPVDNEEAHLAAKELFGESIGLLTDEPHDRAIG